MSDPCPNHLRPVALGAFVIFTVLCFALSRSMNGSALRRGLSFAGIAGLVHLIGNRLTVMGDFGVIGSPLPLLAFSLIQAMFAVLLALAVQSFFPSWYRAFKKDSATHRYQVPASRESQGKS